jgi:hypothetical protein
MQKKSDISEIMFTPLLSSTQRDSAEWLSRCSSTYQPHSLRQCSQPWHCKYISFSRYTAVHSKNLSKFGNSSLHIMQVYGGHDPVILIMMYLYCDMTSERRKFAVREAPQRRPLWDNDSVNAFPKLRSQQWKDSRWGKQVARHVFMTRNKHAMTEELLEVVISIRFAPSYTRVNPVCRRDRIPPP